MATIDWEFHKEQFAKDYAPNGVTKAEYARLHGLSVNSVRREFNSIKVEKPEPKKPAKKKGEDDPINGAVKQAIPKYVRRAVAEGRKKRSEQRKKTSDQPVKSDQTPKSDHISDNQKRSPEKAITQQSDHAENETPEESNSYEIALTGAEGTAAQSDDFDQLLAEPEGDQFSDRDRLRADASLMWGHCAAFVGMEPDIQEMAIAMSVDKHIIQIQTARYMQMMRAKADTLAGIDRDYDNGKPWKDALGNDIPRSRAKAECIFGSSEQFTSLESSINRSLLVSRKLDMEERDAHPLTRTQQIDLTRKIMIARQRAGWSAHKTAQVFEMRGIKLPESLKLELQKEISWLTPPVDEDVGITDAELERLSRDYQEKQKEIHDSWLPSRRAEIAQLFADEQAHQRGDMLTEGEYQEIDEDEATEGLAEFQEDLDGSSEDEPVEEVW